MLVLRDVPAISQANRSLNMEMPVMSVGRFSDAQGCQAQFQQPTFDPFCLIISSIEIPNSNLKSQKTA